MSMEFKVITPDEVAVAATVEYVYLPGSLGEMGVLEHHTALITSLEPGELRYKPMDGPEESMVVGNGFVQVNDDHVLMVTDLALNSSQIDEGSVNGPFRKRRRCSRRVRKCPARNRPALKPI